VPDSSTTMTDGSLTLRHRTSKTCAAMTTAEKTRTIRFESMGGRGLAAMNGWTL